MRKPLLFAVIAAAALVAVPAMAELQNLTIGGDIRIRANYYFNYSPKPTVAGGVATASTIIWPNFFLPRRPIGAFSPIGAIAPFGAITSTLLFDDDQSNDFNMIEQRTRLNFKADFTNDVSAFIELDSYDIWGEDFRSQNWVTGFDNRAVSNNDVEVYQAYIEANEMFGYPLRLRIGRQEMALGSEWLIGTNDTAALFQGLSFDAIRLSYATDVFSVDAFMAKLADTTPLEQDGDVDLYGVYASYLGLEDIVIDAYWLYVRDARRLNDTNFIAPLEAVEDLLGLDNYDATNLHTVGLRGAGTIGNFDFEAEVAYQFGEVDQVGFMFKPFLYGDDGAETNAWGGNLELGYTFDIAWQPRVYLGGAYFDGEDNRDITFLEWLSPFTSPQASVSFNRLFSNWEYSEFIENTELSNVAIIRGGVSAMPTESIELLLAVTYFWALEEFDSPAYFSVGGFKVPVAPALSFLTQQSDDELGLEVGLYATYHYSEDLSFSVGYAHFFTEDGINGGNFSGLNGTGYLGGTSDDDLDYVFFETQITF
ncbi:MAG: hypothetical protein AMXMBFR84_48880 [Candidatus Hydrogenedentota bacterium]